MKSETLKRWGVVLKGLGNNPDTLLDWSWWPGAVCANAQPWPAVWMSRKEAETAARERRSSISKHGPRWRFKVVRVTMTVRVYG